MIGYPGSSTSSGGYICPHCQQFATYDSIHICASYKSPRILEDIGNVNIVSILERIAIALEKIATEIPPSLSRHHPNRYFESHGE